MRIIERGRIVRGLRIATGLALLGLDLGRFWLRIVLASLRADAGRPPAPLTES